MRCPLAIESLVHKSDGLNWAPLRSRTFFTPVKRNHLYQAAPGLVKLRHLYRLQPFLFTRQASLSKFKFHGLLF